MRHTHTHTPLCLKMNIFIVKREKMIYLVPPEKLQTFNLGKATFWVLILSSKLSLQQVILGSAREE